jgi:hypothetical protein
MSGRGHEKGLQEWDILTTSTYRPQYVTIVKILYVNFSTLRKGKSA